MDKKLNVILIASGHLPSGTPGEVFEAFYSNRIKPLVQALDKFPRINMVFRYSGVVLYWIERHHPELFMLFEDLLSRKQAEFLGGGFYDPMLPFLPPADKIGQIEMLTTYLRKHFGKKPQGCWVPAAAWEQNLVGPLSSCGMNYTFMDEGRFSGAGLLPAAAGLFSPCITEDQGKLLTVFPVAGSGLLNGRGILDGLLNGIPAESLPEKEQAAVFPVEETAGASALEYGGLFEGLSRADARVEFTTPAKILKSLRGLRKVYFPGMPGQGAEDGVHPRRFLADHPEAGGIYAKTVHVRTLINNRLRGDKTRKRTALEELWKAQDSGIFRLGTASSPGLFHSPVRKAAYSSLIGAEKITREKGNFPPALSCFDYDLDGEDEYIFQDDKLNCCLKSRGAGIFELDYFPGNWNYLDTLAAGNGGRRCAFADWLAPAGTLPEQAGPEGIPGGRFCGGEEYTAGNTDRGRCSLGFTLPARPGLPWGEIEIGKTWQLKKSSLGLEYAVKNTGKASQRFVFSPSIDLSFPGSGDGYLRVFVQREEGKEAVPVDGAVTVKNVKNLEFQDLKNETIINIDISRSCEIRIFHVYTGLPGSGEYQSTCLMPFFPVPLEEGKTWKAFFSLRISC